MSGLDVPYSVYCEPEGAEHAVEPGDVLTFTFSGGNPHEFEISWVPTGLLLSRVADSDVVIEDKRGRDLRW